MRYLLEKKGINLATAIFAGCICLALILFFNVSIYAQVEPFSISSPPNPVGSGARAMGMGGAFVAVADDATAASWNPAGLIQLQKPEVSAVFSYERNTERRYISGGLEIEDKNTVWDLNYFSMAYPFGVFRRNFVLSLNYQRLYDFHTEASFLGDEFNSKGSLYTLSPAFAIQAAENLFLGFTLNVWSNEWTQKSEWKNTYYNSNSKQIIREEFRDFRGVNANLGIFYRLTPKWTLGAVYKTPFRGRFNYLYFNNQNTANISGDFYGKLESIKIPPTYAVGVSYRFSDAWSLSFDVTRKDWDELVWRNSDGDDFGLFTMYNTDPNDHSPIEFPEIDPTYAFRLGIEFLKILESTVIPVRAGIFYDPVPSIESPHSEYGLSFGSGLSIGDLILDFAYQYRVRYDVPDSETGWANWKYGLFEDRKQHMVLLSGIYHF
ncbi:MAG: OmpP1/FadL family transporter [bacterium]